MYRRFERMLLVGIVPMFINLGLKSILFVQTRLEMQSSIAKQRIKAGLLLNSLVFVDKINKNLS